MNRLNPLIRIQATVTLNSPFLVTLIKLIIQYMPVSNHNLRLCIFLAFMVSLLPSKAQVLKDTGTLNLIRQNIDLIYNFRFDSARMIHAQISSKYPEHPVIYLIRGMITYWENYPLLNTSAAKTSFTEDLYKCIKLSEKHETSGDYAEYLLADMCARGFLLQFYADNDQVMEVIPLASGTYKYLMRTFDYTDQSADLYYFTGVYNYYRDAYPKVYPVYKPLAMLFPKGDMMKGLKQLNMAASNSIALRAEATSLLSYIYIGFENNYSIALVHSMSLYDKYPENLQYYTLYLKNLLLEKQYNEAERIMSVLPDNSWNRYFSAQLTILKGIIQEKKYLNIESAVNYYNQGISELAFFGDYGHEYTAYGYFGLSRISEARGEKNTSQMYRRQALRLADFKKNDFD